MPDQPISYKALMDMYAKSLPHPNPAVRYSIASDGLVTLYGQDGAAMGWTSREGLQYLLDNSPETKP